MTPAACVRLQIRAAARRDADRRARLREHLRAAIIIGAALLPLLGHVAGAIASGRMPG